MFAQNRDLLALEPGVFESAAWLGQRLIEGNADVGGTTLTMTSAGSFEDAGVDAGDVINVAGVVHEVIERTGPAMLTVSRIRDLPGDPPIPPAPQTGAFFTVPGFGPQIGLVHGQVLRMLGIEPGAADASPGEGDVTNPDALRLVEALGALHLVYSAASALSPAGSGLRERAELYRELFARERGRAVARIDLDGDGKPDATRRLNVVQFIRA